MVEPSTPDNTVAIVGILSTLIGTLAGAIIGAVVTRHVQKKQHEHEDRTRLYDMRVTTYAEFRDAATTVASAKQNDGKWPHESTPRYLKGIDTIEIIASKSVVGAMAKFHELLNRPAGEELDNTKIAEQLRKLTTLMRKDVGVSDAVSVDTVK